MTRTTVFFRLSFVLTFWCAALAVVGCGSGSGSSTQTIVITAAGAVTAGSTTQLHATEYNTGASATDVTSTVTWTSSTPAVATVNAQGLVTGIAAGTATISATKAKISGALPLYISTAPVTKLTVTPATPALITGASQQFTAMATYGDGSSNNLTSSVQWSVTPAAAATISAGGLLQTVAAGTFTVSATAGTIVGSVSGTITNPGLASIAITPPSASIVSGSSEQFVCIGSYSDGSKKDLSSTVIWTSSNTTVFGVNASGLATAATVTTAQTATLTAQTAGLSATAAVAVAPQVKVTSLVVKPTSSSIAQGTAIQQTATAYYSDGTQQNVTKQVTWSVTPSSLRQYARYSPAGAAAPRDTSTGDVTVNQNGVASAAQPGAANVQASFGPLQSQSVLLVRDTTIKTIAISTPDHSLPVGSIQQLTLQGLFSDGSTQDLSLTANWQSSNPSVATIDSQGNVTAVAAGTVNFSAGFGGLTTSTSVRVESSSLVSLTIKVPNPVLGVGSVEQLTVIGIYSDGSAQDLTSLATWQSSNPAILQISNSGFLQMPGAGTAQVTATVSGFSTVAVVVGVAVTLVSIEVTPAHATFANGTSLQLSALGIFSNGAQFDITSVALWTPADPTVLTIDADGLAKSGKVGTTAINVSFQGINAPSSTATVTNATLSNLTISPTSARIAASTHAQFSATGWFNDGSVEDLTNDVLWSVSNPNLASIDNGGDLLGLAAGSITVAATTQSLTATVPVTITSATLQSTVINPGNFELPVGVQRQLVLVGNYSDGTTQDLSADAIWISPSPLVAFASQGGLGTAVSPGIGTVSAQLGNFTSSTQIDVTNASLTGISLSPANTVIRERGSQQMTATGTFSDGYQQDLSQNAVFSAANTQLVSLRASGLAFGTGVGVTQITANFRNLTATTPSFTVLSGNLVSFTLTPANPAVTAGGIQQLTATATYDDGTTGDISNQVAWVSSNPAVLSVDGNGLATAHATNATVMVTVSATLGTTTQSLTVTVSPPSPSLGTVSSLTIQPLTSVITVGSTRQFFATAAYTGGSTADVSGTSTWTSSNTGVATINGSGLATAVGTGSTIITATTSTGVVSATTLSVENSPPPTANLTSIEVSPPSASITIGATQQFTATATYSDGTIEDVSSSVTWQSASTALGIVNSAGVATGLSIGTTTVSALLSGVSGTASLTVNVGSLPPSLTTVTAISVTPVNATIGVQKTQVYAAVATYSDGTTQNVTNSVTWTSSSAAVATINSAGLATGVAVGSTAIAAALQGVSGTASLTVANGNPGGTGNPQITSITVTPPTASIAASATQQYTASGGYSDGTTQNISSSVTWTSANSSTATIGSTGLATAAASGSTTITAQSISITGSAALTVNASSATLTALVVTPTSSQIVTGLSQQFAATGTYSDGTTRDLTASGTWTSSNPAVALVNLTGQVTGLIAGTATVTCTSGSLQSQTAVIVNTAILQSLAISPSGGSFGTGAVQQFTLTGTFSNGSHVDLTSAAIWASLTPTVATVSSTGLATGVAAGTVQISGTFLPQTATTTVQVTSATLVSATISPSSAAFAKGTTQQFTVTGTYSDGTTHDVTPLATFSSSNPSVLTVSSAGLAKGVTPGTAHILFSAGGVSGTTQTLAVTAATLVSIALTPTNPTFAAGSTQQFMAIGTFSDGSTQDLTDEAVWSSSNPQTATINDGGLASSGVPGSTQVSVNFQGVTATSGTVQVSSAVLTSLAIAPATAQIAKGTTQQFTVTGTYSDGTTENLSSTASWSSSNQTVASINASGLATGNSIGSAQITAAFGNETASTSSFQVTAATLVSIAFSPSSPSVPTGTSTQVTVTGTFSDGSTQNLTNSSSYSSSNTAAATVSSTGLITGVAPGTSTVTVTVDGVTNTFTATDVAVTLTSIAITPANPANIAKGTTEQFTATGTFSDGSMQNLSSTATWTSTNTAILTVNSSGLATGAGTGTTTLTAAYQGESATSANIQVTAAVVASISVTPANASITAGATQQYTATATYTDATTQNVTSSATWSSSSTSVATISSTTGLATAVAPGSTTIAALYNSISGSTGLTVTAVVAPTLSSITVTPSSATVADGNTQQFTATGNYSDGSTQNLTSSATWQSSAPAVATVNNSGLATGVSGGNAQITAAYSGSSGVATLTVSSASLVSISVTPATVTLAKGTSQQYQATGTLSDGSTQNLTNSVTWSSSNASIATINSTGLASTVGVGSATITATAGSIMGTATMTVTSATVVSLQVIPPTVTLPSGGTQQLMVTAVFTDGSSQNVTSSATYVSPNTGVATVNATGLVKGTGVGSTTLTVSLGSASTTVAFTGTSATLTSIAVTPVNPSLPVGLSQQLTATGTYSDGSTENLTTSVVWTSSAPTVVSVSTTGNAQVAQAGSATITATDGSVSGSTAVTGTTAVVTAITVSPASATLASGQTQQFTATGTLSNGTQQNVTVSATWSSSSSSSGTVSNVQGTNGLLVAAAPGTFTVTATLNSISGSAVVTVTSAVLTSLTVSPSPVSLPAGTTQQLSVTGHYSDGSTANVTSASTWTTTSASVASVDTSGVLHAVAAGTASVTATDGVVSQADAVTVTSAVLSSISITPSSPSVPAGVQVALTATGTYSDGSTSNLTGQVQWTSSAAAVATVSAGGLVSTLTAGSTHISASLNAISTQITLTVTAAAIESISVQASQSTFALGLSLPLTATATYSDSSTQNVTTLVTWSSQTPAIGVVSSSGVATGVTTGTFNARATLSGVTGSLSLTVTNAVLQSIAITPVNPTIVNTTGATQFTATGHYSDGSTQNITNSCHWQITSGLALGSISQTGSFSTTGVGIGALSATWGSITGTDNFTIISII